MIKQEQEELISSQPFVIMINNHHFTSCCPIRNLYLQFADGFGARERIKHHCHGT